MPQELQNSFLYPLGNYHGEFTPGDTYKETKNLWQQLKQSKKKLLHNT